MIIEGWQINIKVCRMNCDGLTGPEKTCRKTCVYYIDSINSEKVVIGQWQIKVSKYHAALFYISRVREVRA